MKKLKYVFIGILVGALLTCTTSVYGESIKEYILKKVHYAVYVNGKEYESEDLPVLNYQGNTYVPLKSMGDVLGTIVYWNEEFSRVEIGDSSILYTSNDKISIPDKNLESIVRQHIKKPTGDIYTYDVRHINSIVGNGDGINSFEGLQHFSSLREIQLSQVNSPDLSVLAGLSKLTFISLYNSNIEDISGLKGLTSLTSLNLSTNRISDISALSELVNLEQLWLGHNHITDIEPIRRLTNLQLIEMSNNPITDLTPLRYLSNIKNNRNGLYHKDDIIYYQLQYSQVAIRLNDKLYLPERTSYLGMYIDDNKKLYLGYSSLPLVSLFLSVNYDKHMLVTDSQNNPFIDGMIFSGNTSFIESDKKYSSATQMYEEGVIYNLNKTEDFPFSTKFDDLVGYIKLDDHHIVLPLSDIFEQFEIDCHIEYDNENNLIIFEFN